MIVYTLDTVVTETPAAPAMSLIVAMASPFLFSLDLECVSYSKLETETAYSFERRRTAMGILCLIGLCLAIVGGSYLAMRPLNEKHDIKPFQHFDDFFI